MTTVEQILDVPVQGNFHGDSALWKAIDALMVLPGVTVEDKCRLLAKLNEITGEDDPCDEAAVAEYVEYLSTGEWPGETV